MPTANEASGQQSGLQASLDAGIESLSQKQQVQFQRFTRIALASDGSVFWVGTQETMIATGSLHYATDRRQEEDSTLGVSDMIFSSESEVTQFSAISPEAMWIGSWPIPDAPPLLVAFSRLGNYYRQADIHHYSGVAITAVMLTQIIQSAADIPAGPIVSNSLPIWLAQTTFAGQTVQVFPSFLMPENLAPPYVVAHIVPELTESLGAFPVIGPWPGTTEPNSGASPLHDLASSQLMRDEVTLTLYGFSNQAAIQYLVMLIEASIDGTAPFGFANSPAIRDEKRTQVELATLAQKKTIQISANYYQGTADAIARRLILSAMLGDIAVLGGVLPQGKGATAQDAQSVAAMGSVFQ